MRFNQLRSPDRAQQVNGIRRRKRGRLRTRVSVSRARELNALDLDIGDVPNVGAGCSRLVHHRPAIYRPRLWVAANPEERLLPLLRLAARLEDRRAVAVFTPHGAWLGRWMNPNCDPLPAALEMACLLGLRDGLLAIGPVELERAERLVSLHAVCRQIGPQ